MPPRRSTRLRGLEAERVARAADATRLLEEVAAAAGVTLGAPPDDGGGARRGPSRHGLAELGLGGTRVEIAVGRRPAGRDEPAVEIDGDALAFDASGIDVVVFRIAPNPGEPARPLARIASGGELSRIALAIEEVLADADATPTLVFDEIDAGIGGRSADPVARAAVEPRAAAPGAVRHAPAADRRVRRRPLRDPQDRCGTDGRSPRCAASTATSG